MNPTNYLLHWEKGSIGRFHFVASFGGLDKQLILQPENNPNTKEWILWRDFMVSSESSFPDARSDGVYRGFVGFMGL